MVDNLTDLIHYEWNLMSSNTNNVNNSVNISNPLHQQSLSRKISDHNNNNNNDSNNNSQHHHAHRYQESVQSPPMIITTDYSDPSSPAVMRVSQALFNRKSLDTGYDTDGGIGTTVSKSKPHRNSSGYEHFVSPRLPPRRPLKQSSNQLPVVPVQQRTQQQNRLAVNPSVGVGQNHDDKNEEPTHEVDGRRRHIRLSRRIPHQSPIPRHNGALAITTSGRPFKLIFLRHSERIDQALGPDWFSKAFRKNGYTSYHQNLPTTLPKRRSDQAHAFDTPLTVRGLKNARRTGHAMLSTNLIADICLSSTALRCIQTAERVLTGMDRTDRISIRIEPGLYECSHLNQKIVDSFMTKKELVDNGYEIKVEYKSLIQKVNVPESLDQYFDRCFTVMRGIIDRYAHHGGTVLIVTHAPGLLALTDAIKGVRPHHETFYRTVATYPLLGLYISEYDGTKWKHSEQPFSITPLAQ